MGFPLTGVKATVDGAKGFVSDMGKMKSSVSKLKGAAGKAASPIKKLGGGLLNIGKRAAKIAAAGLFAVGAAATGVAVGSVKAAISMESAWAGVVKTTDGLEDEFGNLTDAGQKLQDGFREMARETPIAVEELMEIGELGGQLGIAKGELLGFTQTIADLGVATNLTTEGAALGFARIANVMQVPQSEIQNMGSTVVALGNNFATTESTILEFTKRIAGAGPIVGFSTADVMGLSTALSSIGINAEAGGTAAQKSLLAINNFARQGGAELEILAEITGQTAEEFSESWGEDAAGTYADFIEGLGAEGDDAVAILEELGFSGVRMQRALLGLAGAGDLTSDAMKSANEAYEENNALSEEAAKRYETTESQMHLFKNRLNDVAITVGSFLLPMLNNLLEWAGPFLVQFGDALPGIIENNVLPVINDLADWFGLWLPEAIEFLSEFWDEVLLPAVKSFWSWLGESFLPVLGRLANWLKSNLPAAIDYLSGFWEDTLLPALQSVWGYLTESIFPVLSDLLGWLTENIPPAIETLSNFWTETLQPALHDVWTFINESLLPILSDVAKFLVEEVGPVVTRIAEWLIEKFGQVVEWVKENWPMISERIGIVLDWIKEKIETVVGFVQEFWAQHGDTIIEKAEYIWDTIKDVVKVVLEWLGDWFDIWSAIFSGDWEEAWEQIKDYIHDVWDKIGTLVEGAGEFLSEEVLPRLMDALEDIVEGGWDLIKGAFKAAVEALPDIISGAWELVKTIFITLIEALPDIISGAWELVKSAVKGYVKLLANVIPAGWSFVASKFITLIKSLPQVISTAWNVVKAGWKLLIKGLKAVVTEVWPKVKDKIVELIKELPEWIKQAWEDVKAEFRERWEAVKNVIVNYWEGTLKPAIQEKVDSVPGIVESIKDALYTAGQALIDELRDGLESKIGEVTDWFGNKMQDIRDMLPGSRPKDKTSPLYDLREAGAAILANVSEGFDDFDFQGAFHNSVNVAGAFNQIIQEIKSGSGPLQEALSGVFGGAFGGEIGGVGGFYRGGVNSLEYLFQDMDFFDLQEFGSEVSGLARSFGSIVGGQKKSLEEEIALLEERMKIAEQNRNWARLTALSRMREHRQAKLDEIEAAEAAMEAEEERADMLDKRFEILQLISKYGLDADEILGDLDLMDATPLELMQAMQKVMARINDEREDELLNQDELLQKLEEEKALREAQAKLEEAKARQQFLKDQQELLSLIGEWGLDSSEILQGFEFGVGANMTDFIEAMARAIQKINEIMEEEMEIGSPSKKWARYARWTLEGWAGGLRENLSTAVHATQMAVREFATAPTSMVDSRSYSHSTTSYNNRVLAPITVDGVRGGNQDDRHLLGRLIKEEVKSLIRGGS